ncbi:nSTAND1 domain-containing NTPase [Pseudonocardia charpentierae]|uniref:Helix-turn-helix domain-containing protein n=1 Tax=Pseudonocardia charpentierae TaxID=3075545 RepID=A0ABU2N5Z9_9PSEU|nr:helix-turn-helix domain-containing protein [Pseudonocardia sp. DSM 45834]MDT0348913.1 helix-turn-helix domain-containing protein [Pseudonocardia sp. DSM 45834]
MGGHQGVAMAEETDAPERLTPDPARIADGREFARELTLAREHAGLTVRRVQAATGIVASTLGGYFSGRHSPPAESLEAILRACGIDDPEAVRQWHDALGRVRKVPGRRRSRTVEPPYRGLESFQPQDAPWFFGRAELAAAIVAALTERGGRGPLVVVGASGAGKSSVLRAGLIPAMQTRPVLLTPGERPLTTLATHLAAARGADPVELRAALAAEPLDPAVLGVDADLLLVVDQFEEVFGPAVDEAERAAFIRVLCALDAPVVLALRADFYGRALGHAPLARAVQEGQVVVGPMSDDELRAAIVEPARKAEVTVEDGLVEVLLADLHRTGAGAASAALLPLLSHALLATWRRGQGVRMTVADYHAVGGIAGGVAQSAEEVFTQLPDDRQELVRHIFLRLVHVAPDTADTRRHVERAELPGGAEVTEVLDLFVARRLLTVDRHTVGITHEALLTAWPRLRGWIDTDRGGLAVHRRLGEAARAWRDADRDPDLLLRGGRLAAAQEATAERAGKLNELERAFLAAATARQAAERQAERRRTRRLRRLLAVLAVALLIAAGSGAYALKQRGDMARERDVAVSRQVAVRADMLRGRDPSLAAQLAVAAYRISPTPEARAQLIGATGAPTPARLPGPSGTTQSVAVDARRGLVVTAAGSDPTAQVWNRSDSGAWQRLADTPPVADGTVLTVALSPDGRLLAAGAGTAVHLIDLADPAHPTAVGPPVTGAQGTIFGIAFTPDGRTLVAGGADRTVRSWDVSDPAHPVPGAVFTGPGGDVQAVAVSPDGRQLAAGSADTGAYLWDLADPARREVLIGATAKIHAVAFSPDGRTLAAGGADRAVHLWNVADPTLPLIGEPLAGPTTWVNSVAFSPDGRSIAFGSSDNTLRVVDLASRRLVAELPHPSPVTAATFLDDRTLVAGEADGVARVWPVPGPGLSGFADSVFALDWSADGRVLAVGPGSKDGTVSLWRLDDASAALLGSVTNPPGEATFSGSATLSPDGRTVAVGRSDGSVRLWDVSAPDRPVPVEPPLTGSTGVVEQLTTSPDGRTLAVSSDDGTVRLWDISQPRTPRPLRMLTGPTNYVFAATFSPDGRVVAGASADRKGYLWDLTRPDDVPTAVLDGPTSYAYSPAFSPDGHTLAIGSADKTVRLWDVRRLDRPVPLGAPMTGPTNYVYTVVFSPDGTQLAAASTGGTAWLWDVSTPTAPRDPIGIAASTDPLFTVAFSPDGNTLAAGGADRRVHLWTIDPQRAAEALCARTGAPLTPDEWRSLVGDLPYATPCGGR